MFDKIIWYEQFIIFMTIISRTVNADKFLSTSLEQISLLLEINDDTYHSLIQQFFFFSLSQANKQWHSVYMVYKIGREIFWRLNTEALKTFNFPIY